MRVAWATDIHLSFVSDREAVALCDRILAKSARALLLGGDIAEAVDLEHWLLLVEERLPIPIYFVLGNHDFYGASFSETRALAARLALLSPRLVWLCGSPWQRLTETTALVGHGCWGDGRLGAGMASRVQLNDFLHIRDLSGLSREARFAELARQGDLAAATLDQQLAQALPQVQTCMVLTHVPPFAEACWHNGHPIPPETMAQDGWLPHFACAAAGEVILKHARQNPDKHITVLSGHTHTRTAVRILPNLTARVGAAEYRVPRFESILQVP